MTMYPDRKIYESFFESRQKYIPEYYPNMHRDGFEPWEVWAAIRKKNHREFYEYMAARQQAQ